MEAVISFNPQYREENIGYLQRAAAMLGVDNPYKDNQGEETLDWSGYEYAGLTAYGADLLSNWNRYSAAQRTPEAPVYLGSGAAPADGGAINISYAPTLQVSGGTTREELLAMLRQYDEQLADKFMEFKEDLERNERRTRFG